MSRYAGKVYHPLNGSSIDVYEGFSWPCFFAGVFWFLVKGMLVMAILAFLLAFVTVGISWLVFPFVANKVHFDQLLKRGYLTREQALERGVIKAA